MRNDYLTVPLNVTNELELRRFLTVLVDKLNTGTGTGTGTAVTHDASPYGIIVWLDNV